MRICRSARVARRPTRISPTISTASSRSFRACKERAGQRGGTLVGRRAADAGHRPRADEPAPTAVARRALARPRAADRQADFRGRAGPEQERRATVFLVEQNAYHALKLADRAMSWSMAPSRCRDRGANCWRARKSAPPISKEARIERAFRSIGEPLVFSASALILGGAGLVRAGRALARRGARSGGCRSTRCRSPSPCASCIMSLFGEPLAVAVGAMASISLRR